MSGIFDVEVNGQWALWAVGSPIGANCPAVHVPGTAIEPPPMEAGRMEGFYCVSLDNLFRTIVFWPIVFVIIWKCNGGYGFHIVLVYF